MRPVGTAELATRPVERQGTPVAGAGICIGAADAAGLARCLAAVSGCHAVTFVFQDFVNEIPDIRLVVNYEYMSASHFLGSVPTPRSGS